MTNKNNSKNNLIDDAGVHENVKIKHVTIFVTLCRILTVVLIVLGVAALVVGNM